MRTSKIPLLYAIILLAALVNGHAFAAPKPPPCYPQIFLQNIATGKSPVAAVADLVPVSAGLPYDHYSVWVCDTLVGYSTQVWVFKMDGIAPFWFQYIMGSWSKAQADADCLSSCSDPAPADLAFMAPLAAQYRPVATVLGAGAVKVYTVSDAGVRNPVAVVGVNAVPGARCDERVRIKGTSYYRVYGPAITASPATGNVFASCSITFPITPSPLPTP